MISDEERSRRSRLWAEATPADRAAYDAGWRAFRPWLDMDACAPPGDATWWRIGWCEAADEELAST